MQGRGQRAISGTGPGRPGQVPPAGVRGPLEGGGCEGDSQQGARLSSEGVGKGGGASPAVRMGRRMCSSVAWVCS